MFEGNAKFLYEGFYFLQILILFINMRLLTYSDYHSLSLLNKWIAFDVLSAWMYWYCVSMYKGPQDNTFNQLLIIQIVLGQIHLFALPIFKL